MKSEETDSGVSNSTFVPVIKEQSGQCHVNFEDSRMEDERDEKGLTPLVAALAKKEEKEAEEADIPPNTLSPQKMRVFTIFIMSLISILMFGTTAFLIWNYGSDHTPLKQFKQVLNKVTKPQNYSYAFIHEYIHSLPNVDDFEMPVEPLDESANLPFYDTPTPSMCDSVPTNLRFDCAFDNVDITSEICKEKGCCWKEISKKEIPPPSSLRHSELYSPGSDKLQNVTSKVNVPFCFYPKDYFLYKFVDVREKTNGIKGILQQTYRSGLPHDVRVLGVEITQESCSILRIKISDFNNERWESPVPIDNLHTTTCKGDKLYQFDVNLGDKALVIRRHGANESSSPVFDMRTAAPLIYSDQLIQISTLLTSPYVYGLGQHLDGLLLDTYWQQRVLWNADQMPTPNSNLYGSHPFFLNLEPSGDAFGFLLINSNAMDITLQPSPAATFRTTGGILDIYMFLGPSPEQVISQMTERIGTPIIPPYWSLGYHQCRFGYNSLNETKKVWQRTRDADIPFDVQWNDIDYMHNRNDFTYDKERFTDLPEFIRELHEIDMHYVIITDPGISGGEQRGYYPPYDVGIEEDIFVKNSSGQLFIGKVWNPKKTVYPDFTKTYTVLYWAQMMRAFHEELPFDGLWIDMNEPSNFWSGQEDGCPDENRFEHPPYLPSVAGGKLFHKTLCMTANHFLSSHYNVHNLYGITEMIMTYAALRMTEGIPSPFIISRSTFLGAGAFGGHWTGDVKSDWYNMWKSIGDILTMSIHGISMVGADICGFNGNTTVALCNRWMQLGAFYPFARNHNTDDAIDQDPVALGDLVIRSSRNALKQRYMMLPYLYTLFFQANMKGSLVATPLFFNYPQDKETYTIDTQFMWGSALMIVPVLKEDATSVMAYIPEGRWYDWYTGIVISRKGAEYLNLEAPLDTIPLLVAGGNIIPCQFPNITTASSRKNPFYLLVALSNKEEAEGSMYWTEHNSTDPYAREQYTFISFALNSKHLYINATSYKKPTYRLYLGHIKILGVQDKVNEVRINNGIVPFVYTAKEQILVIAQLYLNLIDPWEIKW